MTEPTRHPGHLARIACTAACTAIAAAATVHCTPASSGPEATRPSSATHTRDRDQPGPTGPTLIQDGDNWYITGLSPDAAAAIEQGRLFAASRPIPGTPDTTPVAVLVALGPPGGSTVQVGHQCTALGKEQDLRSGLSAEPLASSTNIKVGQCLARIVDEGIDTSGSRHVILDVGQAFGLRATDEYKILGKSVNASGYVPLGISTDQDGLCQIPDDPTYIKDNITRCVVLQSPPDLEQLKNGFAVWKPR